MGIVHGYGAHTSWLAPLSCWLNAHGWSVASCDLRGHGRSPGRRGHVDHFEDYRRDLDALVAFLRTKATNGSYFLVGDSMGGLILARYGTALPGIQGLILSSPLFGLAMPVPWWKAAAAPILSWIWPTFTLPTGLQATWASRDPAVVAEFEQDPLVHRVATARCFTEMQAAMAEAMRMAPRLSTPLLVLQGDADRVVATGATRRFFDRVGSPDKSLKLYPRFYHALLREVGAVKVWEDIASWIDARSEAA